MGQWWHCQWGRVWAIDQPVPIIQFRALPTITITVRPSSNILFQRIPLANIQKGYNTRIGVLNCLPYYENARSLFLNSGHVEGITGVECERAPENSISEGDTITMIKMKISCSCSRKGQPFIRLEPQNIQSIRIIAWNLLAYYWT